MQDTSVALELRTVIGDLRLWQEEEPEASSSISIELKCSNIVIGVCTVLIWGVTWCHWLLNSGRFESTM